MPADAPILPTVASDDPSPALQLRGDPRFRLLRVRLPIADLLPNLDGFTFLYLSDIHARTRWEPVWDSLLTRLQGAQYRLILFGGDLVENRKNPKPALPVVRRLLGELTRQGTTPLYAILGNHDPSYLPRHLLSEPIRYLLCDRVVTSDGIELIGLPGPHSVVSNAFICRLPPPSSRTPGVPRIVIGHYPFHILQAGHVLRPDLYLSGHTHGGQLCLPGGKPLITHDKLPKQYAADLNIFPPNSSAAGTGTPLLVSRGLGFSNFQIRLFCPPEAHLITLVRG